MAAWAVWLTAWFFCASFWLVFLPAFCSLAMFFSRLAALLQPLPPPMMTVEGEGRGRSDSRKGKGWRRRGPQAVGVQAGAEVVTGGERMTV